jgi:hypothetical protein
MRKFVLVRELFFSSEALCFGYSYFRRAKLGTHSCKPLMGSLQSAGKFSQNQAKLRKIRQNYAISRKIRQNPGTLTERL